MSQKTLPAYLFSTILPLLTLLISVGTSISEEYLMITRPRFVEALDPLVTAKTQSGLSVYLNTLEDIDDNYNGVDVQEKIRNCIIDRYKNHGAKWVLLVGKPDAGDNPGQNGTLTATQIDKPWEIPVRYVYSPTPDYFFVPAESYYRGLL